MEKQGERSLCDPWKRREKDGLQSLAPLLITEDRLSIYLYILESGSRRIICYS